MCIKSIKRNNISNTHIIVYNVYAICLQCISNVYATNVYAINVYTMYIHICILYIDIRVRFSLYIYDLI